MGDAEVGIGVAWEGTVFDVGAGGSLGGWNNRVESSRGYCSATGGIGWIGCWVIGGAGAGTGGIRGAGG